MTHETRESWLIDVMDRCRPLFAVHEFNLPKIMRISVGMCGAKSLGCCVFPDQAEDGSSNIFIDPKTNDPMEIIGIVIHEMAHAHCHSEGHEGHKGKFKTVIREIGLAGKATSTYVEPGTELYATCQGIAVAVGPYPHAPVRGKKKETKPHNWVSFISKTDEDYIVRANRKTVKEKGYPKDFNGEDMVAKDPADMEFEDEDESTPTE